MTSIPMGEVLRGKNRTARLGIIFAVSLTALALSAAAFAQSTTPAAGTTIGNQASATYTDGSNVSRTATSNVVTTVVQQVASFTLTPPTNAKTSTPGGQVNYSHTLTNTGNGSDSFLLTLGTSGTFTHTGTAIYADANGDGVPDNSTNLAGTSVALAAGAVFKFVVVGTVPSSATNNQTGSITVTAKSGFDNTLPTQTNTDTTTVTGNAVINVTKSLNQISGAAGSGPYTVTLTYTNSGNSTATNVALSDVLASGFSYVAGSGRWSVTGATALTDATGDLQPASGSPHIDYSVTGSTVNATIDSIAPGVSGTVTFQVTITAGTPPGQISNTATYTYNDGAANVGPFSTGTVNFTVLQSASVTISDTGVAATDEDATLNDIARVNSATQGATVTFYNVVKNTGNGTDTFNITTSGSTFPSGTSFALYKADGATPLVDTNGDGTPDSGPLAPNATYTVIVKATLPVSASGGGPYNVTVTATSVATGVLNAGASDTVTDQLGTITANTVDVTNGPGLGVGQGPEASPVTTSATNPGTSTTFQLFVKNTSAVADTYNLIASTTTTFGSNNTLPTGWTLVFQQSTNNADCATAHLGASVTNTGVINAGSTQLFCAVVTVPAGYAAGTVDLYFKALSPTSAAFDVKHDAVSVNTVHNVAITPNNTGQVFPGGSVIYVHTITNNGNVTESVSFASGFLGDSLSANAWTSAAYRDDTGTTPGALDSGDTAISTATTFTLAPGASKILLVKVTAPLGAPIGAADVTTFTATYNTSLTTFATDTSTVIAGQLRLTKLQALDANCDGTADTAYGQANITTGAIPGACIRYQITAENQGTADVTSVIVNDSTPAYTVYNDGSSHTAGAATTIGTVTATPSVGSAGTITVNVGTLTPGQQAIITFGVKINP